MAPEKKHSHPRFIDFLAPIIFSDKGIEAILEKLEAGQDASLGVAQSARALMVAAFAAAHERPILYVVSGEEAAAHATSTLTAWLGAGRVFHYPERLDTPFADAATKEQKQISLAKIGQRTQAIAQLASGNAAVVVCSARSLLRKVPPPAGTSDVASAASGTSAASDGAGDVAKRVRASSNASMVDPTFQTASVTSGGAPYYKSLTWRKGQEVALDEAGNSLLALGYLNAGEVGAPGEFRIHGDTIDIFPAQAVHPVRLEFFGDEIDRVRSMVPGTFQTITDLEEVDILPAAEFALTDETVARAKKKLWEAAKSDTEIAADLEAIEARIPNAHTVRYLGALYGNTSSPLEHLDQHTLIVLNEPRALFDDCVRATEEIDAAAQAAHVSEAELRALYTPLKRMNFDGFQRWDFSALIRSTAHLDAELVTRAPQIAGSNERLIGCLRQLINENFRIAFAFPDKGALDHFEQTLLDEHIPFEESRGELLDFAAEKSNEKTASLKRGVITFFSDPVPAGTIIPSVKLAIFSVGDLTQRHAKRNAKTRIDITNLTFPFKPGDYVVHANHGIAKFKGVVRRDLDGYERDYFLLLYAESDKLYVPLERVDYITRYVGPDSQNPRLTRLGTADWTRAKGRARKNAKKLAFDLVDLYTRRAAVTGHAFSPDTPELKEMEAAFPYELTADQARALTDIKADMEATKPMDRLLSGDVGFGKTEVALRAACKAVEDKRQVMLLAPTTILAQQHFETFNTRLAPFNVRVDVLSRIRTPAEQAKTLKDFANGKVDILIGTHRLLSADVNPKNLGLVIVDEEQRFGVAHKEQLKNMREQVDVLALSATPIPRTMQMSMSGVRDMSLIMTPPVGRLPVKVVVHEYDEDTVADAIRAEMARDGQVYYVSNRVKTLDKAVAHVQAAAPEARVAVAHGQMSPRQIEDVMLKFQNKEIDVLIATTIIESGLDNPHTNTLIIEDAQRLGLAQLYQLKGRVGRGRRQAYAYFMFPANEPLTKEAMERLSAINEHQDLGSGIRIAMRDLEIRGAGSLMGVEQHGNLSSVGFDLFTQMLGQAVEEAKGEVPVVEPIDVTINIPANYFFSEEYLPAIDKRVLAYRRVAGAAELFQLENLREELENEYGPLEEAGLNLFARQVLRIRSERLGVEKITFSKGRLTFEGLEVPPSLIKKFKEQGATIFPKTHKVVMKVSVSNSTRCGCGEELGHLNQGDEHVALARSRSASRSNAPAHVRAETDFCSHATAQMGTAPTKTGDGVKYPIEENAILAKAVKILEMIGGDDDEG